HVAAVMAMPVGLAAPMYGIARSVRLRDPLSRMAVMYGPAVLIWFGVQWWARGGVAGALDDFSPKLFVAAFDTWRDPIFVAFAMYFLVTAAGGLTITALANRGIWPRLLRRSPEALVFLAPILVHPY